jgi:hypothetical protein
MLAAAYAELVGPNGSLRVVTPGGSVFDGVTVGGIQIASVSKVEHRLGSHRIDAIWELYV